MQQLSVTNAWSCNFLCKETIHCILEFLFYSLKMYVYVCNTKLALNDAVFTLCRFITFWVVTHLIQEVKNLNTLTEQGLREVAWQESQNYTYYCLTVGALFEKKMHKYFTDWQKSQTCQMWMVLHPCVYLSSLQLTFEAPAPHLTETVLIYFLHYCNNALWKPVFPFSACFYSVVHL